MRAYRKTTQHPYCVYLTAAEAADLVEESEGVDPDHTPMWAALTGKVEVLLADPKKERA